MKKEIRSTDVNLLTTQQALVNMKKLATMKNVSLNEMFNTAINFYVSINEKAVAEYDKFFCTGDGELFPSNPFYDHLEKYVEQSTPEGDFARDMLKDEDRPEMLWEWSQLKTYLNRKCACDECIEAAGNVWKDFAKEC